MYDDHAYTATITSIFADQVTLHQSASSTCQYGEGIGLGAGSLLTAGTWGSNDDIALLSRLRARIEGSTFNALLFLGTGDESLRTIFDGAVRIRKALTQLHRKNFSGAAKALTTGTPRERVAWSFRHSHSSANAKRASRDISENWLELQYGWLPLVSDVYDGAKSLAQLFDVPLKKRIRARYKRDVSDYNTFAAGYTPGSNYAVLKGQYIAYISEVNSVSLFGLTNPADLIWERLPWSFVVDWFIPIQDYLQARGLAQSVSGRFVKTVTTLQRVKGMDYHAPPTGYPWYSGSSYYGKIIKVTRTVSTSLSVPTPELKPLGVVPSWKRCLNAVSLLVQKVFH
jgi:hypothetical protein